MPALSEKMGKRGKIMARRKQIVIDRYIGHCPECGEEQEGRTDTHADRVCDECRKRHATEAFVEKLAFLRDAKIIDFKGERKFNYDGSPGTCTITSITVLTSEQQTIDVMPVRGLWRAVENDSRR